MLILAPMYDVTDTVFRQIIADCAPPDMFMTEFVSVDGLQSAGRPRLEHFIYLETTHQVPVVAQIWGKKPENYYKTAQELRQLGFAGIDINTGCPAKTVVKNDCCAALMRPENRSYFAEILQATKEGADGLPVSVKTRLGWDTTDFSWHEFLLTQGVDMLTIHGRTRKEMSKVPVRWDEIAHIRRLRDQIAPGTKIIGNGDVLLRAEAEEKQQQYNLNGIMIGRGVFHDPFVFAAQSPWADMPPTGKIELYIKHLQLYRDTYASGERRFDPVKKFMKVYINGFDGASELRDQIAHTNTAEAALAILENAVHTLHSRT